MKYVTWGGLWGLYALSPPLSHAEEMSSASFMLLLHASLTMVGCICSGAVTQNKPFSPKLLSVGMLYHSSGKVTSCHSLRILIFLLKEHPLGWGDLML